ncbi:protein SCAF11 isoform X2 [Pseudophryne corroboree]|uniref:protein SCAF11 isoform X2 n=1 Tax=Pseudophryne corroboree TaxID=495146 RepID=UPI003081B400
MKRKMTSNSCPVDRKPFQAVYKIDNIGGCTKIRVMERRPRESLYCSCYQCLPCCTKCKKHFRMVVNTESTSESINMLKQNRCINNEEKTELELKNLSWQDLSYTSDLLASCSFELSEMTQDFNNSAEEESEMCLIRRKREGIKHLSFSSGVGMIGCNSLSPEILIHPPPSLDEYIFTRSPLSIMNKGFSKRTCVHSCAQDGTEKKQTASGASNSRGTRKKPVQSSPRRRSARNSKSDVSQLQSSPKSSSSDHDTLGCNTASKKASEHTGKKPSKQRKRAPKKASQVRKRLRSATHMQEESNDSKENSESELEQEEKKCKMPEEEMSGTEQYESNVLPTNSTERGFRDVDDHSLDILPLEQSDQPLPVSSPMQNIQSVGKNQLDKENIPSSPVFKNGQTDLGESEPASLAPIMQLGSEEHSLETGNLHVSEDDSSSSHVSEKLIDSDNKDFSPFSSVRVQQESVCSPASETECKSKHSVASASPEDIKDTNEEDCSDIGQVHSDYRESSNFSQLKNGHRFSFSPAIEEAEESIASLTESYKPCGLNLSSPCYDTKQEHQSEAQTTIEMQNIEQPVLDGSLKPDYRPDEQSNCLEVNSQSTKQKECIEGGDTKTCIPCESDHKYCPDISVNRTELPEQCLALPKSSVYKESCETDETQAHRLCSDDIQSSFLENKMLKSLPESSIAVVDSNMLITDGNGKIPDVNNEPQKASCDNIESVAMDCDSVCSDHSELEIEQSVENIVANKAERDSLVSESWEEIQSPQKEPVSVGSDTPQKELVSVGSDAPNKEPVSVGSDAPNKEPVSVGSDAPNKEPVSVGSDAPNKKPVSVGSDAPNKEPVSVGSDAPNKEPVSVGSDAPNKEPVSVGSDAPNKEPVSVDKDAPNKEPVSVGKDAPQKEPVSGGSDTPQKEPVSGGSDTPQKEPVSGGSDTPQKEPVSVGSDIPQKEPVSGGSDTPKKESRARKSRFHSPSITWSPTKSDVKERQRSRSRSKVRDSPIKRKSRSRDRDGDHNHTAQWKGRSRDHHHRRQSRSRSRSRSRSGSRGRNRSNTAERSEKDCSSPPWKERRSNDNWKSPRGSERYRRNEPEKPNEHFRNDKYDTRDTVEQYTETKNDYPDWVVEKMRSVDSRGRGDVWMGVDSRGRGERGWGDTRARGDGRARGERRGDFRGRGDRGRGNRGRGSPRSSPWEDNNQYSSGDSWNRNVNMDWKSPRGRGGRGRGGFRGGFNYGDQNENNWNNRQSYSGNSNTSGQESSRFPEHKNYKLKYEDSFEPPPDRSGWSSASSWAVRKTLPADVQNYYSKRGRNSTGAQSVWPKQEESQEQDQALKDQPSQQNESTPIPVNIVQPPMNVVQPPMNAPPPPQPMNIFPYPVGVHPPIVNIQHNPYNLHPQLPIHLHPALPLVQVSAPSSVPQGLPPPPPPPPPSQQVSYIASQQDGKPVQGNPSASHVSNNLSAPLLPAPTAAQGIVGTVLGPSSGSVATSSHSKNAHVSVKSAAAKESITVEASADSSKKEKKMQIKERAAHEVKVAIKQYYQNKDITKEEYKEIVKKAVDKVCHSKSGEVDSAKVANLVKAYVDKYKHSRKKEDKL